MYAASDDMALLNREITRLKSIAREETPSCSMESIIVYSGDGILDMV